MRVTYDRIVDAAYVYLVPIAEGQVSKTYPCDPNEVRGQINLDFDSSGRLVGLEILDASRLLPLELLREAELLS